MTVLEKAKAKLDAAQRGMSYRLPGYDKSDLQWWTAYIEGAEDQKQEDAAAIEALQAQLPKLGGWQKAKPKGVVTYSDGYAECSNCHETIWLGWGMNFCPHCGTQNKIIDPDDYDGAKMEVQDGK